MSVQNIPLKGRTDFQQSSRILVAETIRIRAAAPMPSPAVARMVDLWERSYVETRVWRTEFYLPVAFRRAPAARKSASDDRFTAGARLRWYLSRRSALPARAHIASDGVTVPARWPSRSRRAAPSFRRALVVWSAAISAQGTAGPVTHCRPVPL